MAWYTREVLLHSRKTEERLYIAFLGALTAGCAILAIFAKHAAYFSFDLPITLAIQRFHAAWFRTLMQLVTALGNPVVALLVTFAVLLVFLWKREFILAALLASSVTGTTVLGLIIKYAVNRPRPSASLIAQAISQYHTASFPSGHVIYFVSFYGFLLYVAYVVLQKSIRRTLILIGCAILLALIGPSRIYLGAHWFSDVIGAYAIGFVCLSTVCLIEQTIRHAND